MNFICFHPKTINSSDTVHGNIRQKCVKHLRSKCLCPCVVLYRMSIFKKLQCMQSKIVIVYTFWEFLDKLIAFTFQNCKLLIPLLDSYRKLPYSLKLSHCFLNTSKTLRFLQMQIKQSVILTSSKEDLCTLYMVSTIHLSHYSPGLLKCCTDFGAR